MNKKLFIALFCAVAVCVFAAVGFTMSASRTTELAPTALPTEIPELRVLEPEKSETQQEIDRLMREIETYTAPPAYYFTPDPATVAHEYVLNTNTKTFHLPSCRFVSSIDSENRETVWRTRGELLDAGFDPCGVCHP